MTASAQGRRRRGRCLTAVGAMRRRSIARAPCGPTHQRRTPTSAEAWGQRGTIDSAPARRWRRSGARPVNAGHVVIDWRIVVLKLKIVRLARASRLVPTAPDMLQHCSTLFTHAQCHGRPQPTDRTRQYLLTSSEEWTRTCSHLRVVQPALADTLTIPKLAAARAPGLASKAPNSVT